MRWCKVGFMDPNQPAGFRLWSVSYFVLICFFSAELQQASVWGEKLAATLPLPVLIQPWSRDLLHHRSALHTLEPGSFPLPSPRQHVDGKSQPEGGISLGWSCWRPVSDSNLTQNCEENQQISENGFSELWMVCSQVNSEAMQCFHSVPTSVCSVPILSAALTCVIVSSPVYLWYEATVRLSSATFSFSLLFGLNPCKVVFHGFWTHSFVDFVLEPNYWEFAVIPIFKGFDLFFIMIFFSFLD